MCFESVAYEDIFHEETHDESFGWRFVQFFRDIVDIAAEQFGFLKGK